MTVSRSQPMKDEPTPQEWQAWADEAQACVDSGEVVISDHRKAQATIAALREHAALKARNEDLEALLLSGRKHLKTAWTYAGLDSPVFEMYLKLIDEALQPKAGS